MNKKLAESIALLAILLLGIAYLYKALTMGDLPVNSSLPPGYFPTIIGVIWVALTLVTFIEAVVKIKGCKETFAINKAGYWGLTILAIVVYLCVWKFLHMFYIGTFLFIFFLMELFCPKEQRFNKKQILLNAGLTLLVVGVIYVMFQIVLHVRF